MSLVDQARSVAGLLGVKLVDVCEVGDALVHEDVSYGGVEVYEELGLLRRVAYRHVY